MTRGWRQGAGGRLLLAAGLLLVMSGAAHAQGTRTPVPASTATRPGAEVPRRLEVSLGGGFLLGAALGDADTSIRANANVARPYPLFATSTRQAPAPTVDVRVGTWLTRRFGAEAALSCARPEVRTSVTADVEGAPNLTVVERIDQYVIEGRFLVSLDQAGRRPLHPFLAAGVGYLRQLHEGLITIESGHVVHLGGGVRHTWRSRPTGFLRRAGVRAEAGVKILSGGVTVTTDTRVHGVATGSLVLGF